MSKTFREMAETKGRDIRKDILDEIYQSEVEFDMDSVFVIIEVTAVDDYEIEEIVDGSYFITKSEAWESLYAIAGLDDVELNQNEYTFEVPTPTKGVDRQYYYIQELWRG